MFLRSKMVDEGVIAVVPVGHEMVGALVLWSGTALKVTQFDFSVKRERKKDTSTSTTTEINHQ